MKMILDVTNRHNIKCIVSFVWFDVDKDTQKACLSP